MASRHTMTPAPAETGNGRRTGDQLGGEITPTILDIGLRAQPAELPRIVEALRLAGVFGLSIATAAVVAELAFDGRRA